MELLWVLLRGTIIGIAGAGLGGVLGVLIGRPSDRVLAGLLTFSGGLMVAVVCFDLIPEALLMGGWWILLLGVGLGLGTLCWLEGRIAQREQGGKLGGEERGLKRAGLLLGLGIALHNFPEGLAVGSTAAIGSGWALAMVIVLHDIPEGISTAVPLRAAGMSPLRVLLFTLLSGLPTGIGALVGHCLAVGDGAVALCLGLAAGAMLYVTLGELLRQSMMRASGRVIGITFTAGLILGLWAVLRVG